MCRFCGNPECKADEMFDAAMEGKDNPLEALRELLGGGGIWDRGESVMGDFGWQGLLIAVGVVICMLSVRFLPRLTRSRQASTREADRTPRRNDDHV